jgi:hypothetical protein
MTWVGTKGVEPRCVDHSESALYIQAEAERKAKTKAEETKEASKMEKHEFHLGKREQDGEWSALVGIKMSDIKSRKMKYLWEGRIPQGKGVVIHGEPGNCKSQAVLSLAALISNGADWPDKAVNDMGARKVLIAGTEDDVEDTIKPRLQALGANMDNIVWLVRSVAGESDGTAKKRRILLKQDMKNLLRALKDDPKIVAVVFDPITGYYGDMDGNSNKDIRAVIEQLAEVLRITHVNAFTIIHENRRTDVSAINKILGAGALGQVFRVAYRFSKHPDGEKYHYVMAPSKANLTKCGSMEFNTAEIMVTLDDGGQQLQSYVVWGKAGDQSADDVILATKKREKEEATGEGEGVMDQITQMLQTELVGGRKLISSLHDIREEMGIKAEAMYKAKRQLHLVTTNEAGDVLTPAEAKGQSGLYWGLPTGDLGAAKRAFDAKIQKARGVMMENEEGL